MTRRVPPSTALYHSYCCRYCCRVQDILNRREKELGAKGFSPQGFRCTFVGDLTDETGDLSAAQKLAGHASGQTTARYNRRGERAKKAAASHLRVPYRPPKTTDRALKLFCGLPLLQPGVDVTIADANRTSYSYAVSEIHEVGPHHTWVTNPVPGRDILFLQTRIEDFENFWTEGHDVARYVVQADRVS
ncbi:MAG: hypothetical protein M3R38_10250 [Actinomycetota bacterium]|nr:hypothetical protein [Actinomycetota bacterium]